jgi:carbamoyltransferase
MDLACSLQVVTEEIMLRQARHVHAQTGEKNLVLAGGVALNCVGNGRILREGPFEKIWIQPAAGDAGGALGAALFAWYAYGGNERNVNGSTDMQKGSLVGPSFSDDEIGRFLQSEEIPAHRLEPADLPEVVADLIAGGNVIGWFQGRMEFGPRALGSRSIIGDARSPRMQSVMNLKIKFRESFRPFAPSVLEEKASDWFDIDCESPYMLLVAPVSDAKRFDVPESGKLGIDKLNEVRSEIPAVTHVDYSARIQTVDEHRNPVYHALLSAFYRKTGCPVIINTSFNVRGEPIVCTPAEAFRCFMRTHMDYLVLGSYLLAKKDQSLGEENMEWMEEFELD